MSVQGQNAYIIVLGSTDASESLVGVWLPMLLFDAMTEYWGI